MTFCTKNHDLYFGDVVDGRMELSEIGKFALHCIEKIPEITDNVAISCIRGDAESRSHDCYC